MQYFEAKEKSIQTCIKKYGVNYPMQNSEISEKQFKKCYKYKKFIFSCNNIINVQGYEPFLLNILVNNLNFTFNDIVVNRKNVPEIWYEYDNKKHRYYCDIYIPKINTIFEVKSTWTYKKDIKNIELKKIACLNSGYLFILFIFDENGNIILNK